MLADCRRCALTRRWNDFQGPILNLLRDIGFAIGGLRGFHSRLLGSVTTFWSLLIYNYKKYRRLRIHISIYSVRANKPGELR